MSDTIENSPDPFQYWIQIGRWCKEYFEQDSQIRDNFERNKSLKEFEQKHWLQKHCAREPFRLMYDFHLLQHLFVRKKSSASLHHKNLQSTFQTLSDQLLWEIKSTQYRNLDYTLKLKRKSSYMHKSPLNITNTSKSVYQIILKKEQTFLQNILFCDDLFNKTCESMEKKNKTIII